MLNSLCFTREASMFSMFNKMECCFQNLLVCLSITNDHSPSTSWQPLIIVAMLSQHTSGFNRICDYFVKLTQGLKYNLDRP